MTLWSVLKRTRILYRIDQPFQLSTAVIAQPDTLYAVCQAQGGIFVSLNALDSDRKVGYIARDMSLP